MLAKGITAIEGLSGIGGLIQGHNTQERFTRRQWRAELLLIQWLERIKGSQ